MTDVRTERCRDGEMKECRDAGCRYRAMKRWREDRVAMDREKMKRCRDREMYGSIDAWM